MTDNQSLYAARRMSAADAVQLVSSGSKLCMSPGASQPPALLEALADRARSGAIDNVRLYYMLSTGIAGKSALLPEFNDRIIPVSIFHSGVERALDKVRAEAGQPLVDFIPSHFSQIPRLLTEHVGVDTLIATVSSMDADGFFSLGTNIDYSMVAARSGAKLILEVNRHMPYAYGESRVHVSQVAAIVENDVPLMQLPPAPLSDADKRIGAIVAGMVDDGACIQMGIGALPDAVCAALANHRHLGIHTEMLAPGLVNLIKSGAADNSRKQIHVGKTIYTFALGDQPLYDFIDGNVDVEAYPVDYVNAPHIVAQNDNVVSVNATLQVDFGGACNSEYMGRQFSAVGGQVDFVRGAYASRGGKSIIACHSTAAKGTISRIVPMLDGPVTTLRTDTHIIVTEYGYAELKGKSMAERAAALIAIAHPDFRDALERQAYDSGILARRTVIA